MTSPSNPDLKSAIDTRLEAALEQSHYRATLANQKLNARLKHQRDLIFAIGGGSFVVSMELISFVNCLIADGRSECILLDSNQNPVEILDLEDFKEQIMDRYFEATNDFLVQFKSIQKSRSVKAAVGIK